MNTPKQVISDILQIRFATFFETQKGSDMAADIVIRALEEAGYNIVRDEDK